MLVVKPEGTRPLGRLRPRWENNMKLGVLELLLESVDWIHVAQDSDWWQAFVNTIEP
jgi:hypothetical protein